MSLQALSVTQASRLTRSGRSNCRQAAVLIVAAQLARINGPAKVGRLPAGNNSASDPYRPNFLGSCCYKGQNTTAPDYVLRP
jgi:hypothetical protein